MARKDLRSICSDFSDYRFLVTKQLHKNRCPPETERPGLKSRVQSLITLMSVDKSSLSSEPRFFIYDVVLTSTITGLSNTGQAQCLPQHNNLLCHLFSKAPSIAYHSCSGQNPTEDVSFTIMQKAFHL